MIKWKMAFNTALTVDQIKAVLPFRQVNHSLRMFLFPWFHVWLLCHLGQLVDFLCVRVIFVDKLKCGSQLEGMTNY
jgi:hypothetical protein